jgi:uncharacterized protein (TIGR02996 family)
MASRAKTTPPSRSGAHATTRKKTSPEGRHPGLEAAIAAKPGDDAPYLVYADWYETRGDTRRATALRVLGGHADASPDGVDAGRLALAASAWLEDGSGYEWEDPYPEPRSPDDVRATRRKELLPLFLQAWGTASPFEPDEVLCRALEESEAIDDELALPRGAKVEDAAFEHVPVNQNGTVGISGALLLAPCDVTTAFDVLAAHLTSQDLEDLRGQARSEAIDDASDWLAVSRAQAYGSLYSSLAGNEGHGLKRGRREVELQAVLDELGSMRAAVFSQTEFTWMLMQFERGWLAFYATF